MPWVGFEPMIPASDRAKTVHALDRSATVTGILCLPYEIDSYVLVKFWKYLKPQMLNILRYFTHKVPYIDMNWNYRKKILFSPTETHGSTVMSKSIIIWFLCVYVCVKKSWRHLSHAAYCPWMMQTVDLLHWKTDVHSIFLDMWTPHHQLPCPSLPLREPGRWFNSETSLLSEHIRDPGRVGRNWAVSFRSYQTDMVSPWPLSWYCSFRSLLRCR
jgi:hypothetical protein